MLSLNPKKILNLSIVTFTTIVYVLLFFFLYKIYGKGVATIALLPIIFFGIFYGLWGGIIAGVLSFPVNIILYQLSGGGTLYEITGNYGFGGFVGQLAQIAIGGTVGYVRDLSQKANRLLREREIAENALMKAKDTLEERVKERTADLLAEKDFSNTLIQSIPVFFVTIDKDGKVGMMNNTMLNTLGYTLNEVKGREYINTFVFEHDREELRNVFNKISKFHEPTLNENRVVTKDGSILQVEWHGTPILKKNKEMDFFIGVGIDITERKKLEEDRIRLSTAIEQVDEIIIITDKDENIQYANPVFQRITGYSHEEAVGQSMNLIHSGEHSETFYVELGDAISHGKVWKGHIINKRKDGSFYDTQTTISPVKNGAGEITNYVAVQRDVTQERKLENQLLQSQKMESIGTLAGGISHDFNNILGGIIGLTELALDNAREMPETYGFLTRALKSADRATDLVRQILTFSRQTEHEKEQVYVSRIVKEVTKFLRASLPTTIEFQQNIKAENDLIMADPTQIHQVLMNLCTNAGHAMKETGGVLEVVLDEVNLTDEDLTAYTDLKSGPYLRLTVSDTGAGIEKENLERIFDPYFTTKKKGEGTGLGLAVVHGIVKDHGGDIKLYSEVGKGTTFQVCFPLLRKEEGTTEKKPTVQIPTGNETILFADDEETLVFAGKHILERLGYRVVTSTRADEALEIFKKEKETFDLVITDKTMPHMTGFDLAREIKNIRSDIPIIMCTGFNDKADAAKADAVGIQEFIMKPLNKLKIAETIRKVLEQKES